MRSPRHLKLSIFFVDVRESITVGILIVCVVSATVVRMCIQYPPESVCLSDRGNNEVQHFIAP